MRKICQLILIGILLMILASCKEEIGTNTSDTVTVITSTSIIEVDTPHIILNDDFVTVYEVGLTKPNFLEAAIVDDPYNPDAILMYENIDDSGVNMNKCGSYDVFFAYQNVMSKITIEIVDTLQPQINLIGQNVINLSYGNAYVELGATVIDNYDTDLSNRLSVSGEVDIYKVGSYEIIYSVSDTSENHAEPIKRIVNVIDDLSYMIKDDNLELAIRNHLGIVEGPITFDDAKKIAVLDLRYKNISNIEGIEYLTNLYSLNLSANQITDITPLKVLFNNTYINNNNGYHVYLSSNPLDKSISSTTYETLTFLRDKQVRVDIAEKIINDGNNTFFDANVVKVNSITDEKIDYMYDFDIFKLKPITNVNLSIYTKGNLFTKIELYDMDFQLIQTKEYGGNLFNAKLNLKLDEGTYYIKIKVNPCVICDRIGSYELIIEEDIPPLIKGLTVTFSDPLLEDIIRKEINRPTGDIRTSDCLKIESLNLEDYKIVSLIGLEKLQNLSTLLINAEYLQDLEPIRTLTQLEYLSIHNGNISDITPLSNLVQLKYLSLRNNEITNISALENLNALIYLKLTDNNITDFTVLQTMFENGAFNSDSIKKGEYHITIAGNPMDLYFQAYVVIKELHNKFVLVDVFDQNFTDDYPNDFYDSEVINLNSEFIGKMDYIEDIDYMYGIVGSRGLTIMDQEAWDILYDYVENYWHSDLEEEDMFATAFTKAGERIMSDPNAATKMKTSVFKVLIIVVAIIIIISILRKWQKDRALQKQQEDENLKEILNTPLEKFGSKEMEDLIDKYEKDNTDDL